MLHYLSIGKTTFTVENIVGMDREEFMKTFIHLSGQVDLPLAWNKIQEQIKLYDLAPKKENKLVTKKESENGGVHTNGEKGKKESKHPKTDDDSLSERPIQEPDTRP